MSALKIPTLPAVEPTRIVLNHVSWAEYEDFLQLYEGMHRRLTYHSGVLEIMTVSQGHEEYKELLVRLMIALTETLDLRTRSLGNATWKREEMKKALEADACWYIKNEPRVRNRRPIDLEVDPPPDLALEIEVSRSVLNRLDIYAALGISEVWRFDGTALRFLWLQSDGQYLDFDHSLAFPKLKSADLLRFIHRAERDGDNAASKAFRVWVRKNILRK